MSDSALILAARIEGCIIAIRGERVILDADIAALYGVETKMLVRAVKRNTDRFPRDFMFQLTQQEFDHLRSHSGTSSSATKPPMSAGRQPGKGKTLILRSQFGTSSWGGRRYRPYAFTEQGVAMLSSVLRSKRAVQVNVEIMRAFVRLRQLLGTHKALARKLAQLESRYDQQFKVVFDALRALMAEEEPLTARKPIGFQTERQE